MAAALRHERLFAAIDAALGTSGMVSDLSRLIAQYARPIRWADWGQFKAESDGRTISLDRA
jgi:hypothetical protein